MLQWPNSVSLPAEGSNEETAPSCAHEQHPQECEPVEARTAATKHNCNLLCPADVKARLRRKDISSNSRGGFKQAWFRLRESLMQEVGVADQRVKQCKAYKTD